MRLALVPTLLLLVFGLYEEARKIKPLDSWLLHTLMWVYSELEDWDMLSNVLEGITQVQVHEKAGLTFARALRAILRQDPDVILVGEVRDGETAKTAFDAAMTGHLVLTTLHTTDCVSAASRLVELGVPRDQIIGRTAHMGARRAVVRLIPR